MSGARLRGAGTRDAGSRCPLAAWHAGLQLPATSAPYPAITVSGRQSHLERARTRRSVRVGETAPGWLRPCITVILHAMSRWCSRLPGRLPRRCAARCWWSRSDAQTEAVLPRMPVSARWVPRRKRCTRRSVESLCPEPGRRAFPVVDLGARPVSRQVEQPIAHRPGAMCCDRRNGLAKPQLPRMLVPSCRTEAGQNAIGGDVDVAGLRVGVDDTDPEDLRQDPVQATRTAADHAGSASDPATCCREVLRGWHGWLEHPGQNGASRERAS